MDGLIDLIAQLGELKDILLGALNGDNSQLSSEGSLAGSDGAGAVGGSVVGSVVGSLGGEDLINQIPGDIGEALGSAASAGSS
ncbi:MAG: hypothetical protein ACTH1D_11490 [Mycobacteriaceae bacterium]|uniref:hypothetical protein n=1 Tax=Corynebacterium sp. TaxID=1720 RepID=UPI003F97DC6D